MNTPLVSVICLCYNHEHFVAEAIQSVRNQTYPNVELIVVDDHSTDHSAVMIRKAIASLTDVNFIPLPQNVGNCRAFNIGFRASKGDFIIDLSADDILMADRIKKGVTRFQSLGAETGVNFTDAELIDDKGTSLGMHSAKYPSDTIPEGDVYEDLISKYFICSPSMMIRREVLEKLGGYDESLAYEDFDFWIRSSRDFRYCYTPEPLVKKRMLQSSLGKRQHKWNSAHLQSTLKVCEKALALSKTRSEHAALKKRIRYELRRAVQFGQPGLAARYLQLLWETP